MIAIHGVNPMLAQGGACMLLSLKIDFLSSLMLCVTSSVASSPGVQGVRADRII